MTIATTTTVESRDAPRPRAGARRGPAAARTRRSAACCSSPDGDLLAEGWHRGAGTPARRGGRALAAAAPAPRPAPPRSSPSNPATTPAAPAPALGRADRGRRRPRRLRAPPTRTRSRPAAPTRLRAAGVEVVAGRARGRGGGAQRALAHRRRASAARGSPRSGRRASTAAIAAADGTSRWITGPRPPARTSTAAARARRHRRRHRHRPRRRPGAHRQGRATDRCCRTSRSPSSSAHATARADARLRAAPAPAAACRDHDPRCGPRRDRGGRRDLRLPRGRPDARQRLPRRRPRRRGARLPRADAARRPTARHRSTSACRRSPTSAGSTCARCAARPRPADRRPPAAHRSFDAQAAEERTECSPASSRSAAAITGWERTADGGARSPSRRRSPIATPRTATPSPSAASASPSSTHGDGTLHRRRDGADARRQRHRGPRARGDEVNLERAAQVGDRLGGHIVQGHVDGVGGVLCRCATRARGACCGSRSPTTSPRSSSTRARSPSPARSLTVSASVGRRATGSRSA